MALTNGTKGLTVNKHVAIGTKMDYCIECAKAIEKETLGKEMLFRTRERNKVIKGGLLEGQKVFKFDPASNKCICKKHMESIAKELELGVDSDKTK